MSGKFVISVAQQLVTETSMFKKLPAHWIPTDQPFGCSETPG